MPAVNARTDPDRLADIVLRRLEEVRGASGAPGAPRDDREAAR